MYNDHPILTDDIENPDFETGYLTGWTVVEGNSFTDENVTDDTDWGWGGPFNHTNQYHLWGAKTGDDKTGTLKSTNFILSGSGEISFLIGGGNDPDNLYVALVRASDEKELMKETNKDFADSEAYSRVTWDASSYIGEEVYMKIVDKATGGWGHINVDDFRVKKEGLFAHWSFDESEGAKAVDAINGIEDSISY